MWEVEYTNEFGEWWRTISEMEQEMLAVAVEKLGERGPALGRPFADTVEDSRHRNMKELRPPATNIRVFFAFDPRRMAILLIGGDKTGQWKEFYEEMIPVADELYDEHLNAVRGRRGAMSGRRNFGELRKEIERDPARRARMDKTRKAYDALLHLADLRRSRGLTQAELASTLGVSQPNISKIERGAEGSGEVLLSTLAEYVEALGGRLEVRAIFPEHPEADIAVAVGRGSRCGGEEDPDARR